MRKIEAIWQYRPTSNDSHIDENPKFIYKLFLYDKRYPRFTEAARYWLQWRIPRKSLFPQSRKNDYTDDYKCRENGQLSGRVRTYCPTVQD